MKNKIIKSEDPALETANNSDIDQSLKLVARSSIIIFAGIIISKILTYIYRIIIARQFGPEIYGVFSLILMMIGFLTPFINLGLNEGLLRFIPQWRGKNETKKIEYATSFSTKFILLNSIIISGILFLLADFISITLFKEPQLTPFTQIVAVFLIFMVFSRFLLIIIRSYEYVVIHTLLEKIIMTSIHVLFLILLISIGLNSDSIIYSYVAGFIIVTIISYIYINKIIKLKFHSNIDDSEKKTIRKELLFYSIPIMFSGIITVMFTWVDTFFIGYFLGTKDVGIYNAAVPIATLMLITQEIFLHLLYPIFNREFSKDNIKNIDNLSKQVTKWIFMINLPILLFVLIYPHYIINLLFGPEYVQASNSLRILSIGVFLSSIFYVSQRLILVKGKSKILFWDLFYTSILNIILNIILTPKLGINGAAFATTFSWIILSLLWIYQTKKYLNIVPLRRKMLNISLVSIIPFLFLIYIGRIIKINNLSIVLIFITYILLYYLLLLMTKCLDKNDITILKAFTMKIFKTRS
ncbi:hypothetical protein COU57_05870 [Candidatus Pacearchaeota archaeon CG10_big_fil_rev_8_21_14_0_10_32_14]|nr:MAG: hypothetical protein COU57_05870 [Candidatus Pacearchaeota archaeon CG10_big_fil_rev_8_21_14_0_10_32_14]